MIKRVSEVFPANLVGELLRLARLDRDWVRVVRGGPSPARGGAETYRAETKHQTWVQKAWRSGADAFSMWGASIWLVDGPKFFRPSSTQCRVLEQVSVDLTLADYAQPYPALLVDLTPEGGGVDYGPFKCALSHFTGDFLSVSLMCPPENDQDITTTVIRSESIIEEAIQRFDLDCATLAPCASRALRVAVNCCLALVNYGCHAKLLYPKEFQSDSGLAREQSERGARARERVKTAPSLISFDREVTLHTVEPHPRGPDTGAQGVREMPTHWRRGCWAMQAHGPGRSLRKRIFRRPVLVRADKFLGDPSQTSTAYHT